MTDAKIVFFTNKNYKNNPMLKMYNDAFSSAYQCYYSCTDSKFLEDSDKSLFIPDNTFYWGYFTALYKKIIPLRNRGKYVFKGIGKVKYFFGMLYYILYIIDYIIANIRIAVKMALVSRKKNIKTVFSIDADYLLASYLYSKYKKSSFIYSVYEMWPEEIIPTTLPEYFSGKARVKLERFLCHKADKIITVDETWNRIIRRRYLIEDSKFIVVPVCPYQVDLPNIQTLRNPIKFHYHGGLLLSRGLDSLIKAFEHIEDGVLYIRGSGFDEQKIKNLINELRLESKVYILPSVPMEQLVSQALVYDVGIIIAKPDTLNGRMCTGFKFFEYMNSGLAIMAPSSYPLVSFINKLSCGINYGWPNTDTFINEINNLIKNKSSILYMKKSSIIASQYYNSRVQKKRLFDLVLQY